MTNTQHSNSRMESINSRLDLAHKLMEGGEYEEAISISSDVLDEEGENLVALWILTRCFVDLGKPGFAKTFAEKTVRIVPNDAGAWVNLGNAHQKAFEIDDVVRCNKRALEIDPFNFAALNNLAIGQLSLGDPEGAIKTIRRAEAINPGDVEARETLGLAQLALQQWNPGWSNYNVGVGRSSDRKRRSYLDHVEPVWDGAKGKTVVLYGEQGLGDEISFASVVPQMKNDCNLIIETQAKLEGLFKRSFDVPVYGTRYAYGLDWIDNHKIDCVISMGQAMELYRSRTEDFTGKSYLVADPQRRKWWRAILDTYPGKKIGIAWNGGITITGKGRRSISLEDFAPLLKSGHTFVSLEYLDPSEELSAFREKHGIEILDFSRFILNKDYDDTAALVSELDHVVSVTTAIVDLCGALGRSCDVMVPRIPHWKYHGQDTRSIWYDSINLVRQKGTWKQTMEEYAASIHWQ